MSKNNENIGDSIKHQAELSEMKSRFLSIASHEFRTPLAGIMSSLNIIRKYQEKDHEEWERLSSGKKVKSHLDKIEVSVKNLNSILNKFLALSKLEKGEIPVRYSKFDFKREVELQLSQLQAIAKSGQRIFYTHTGANKSAFLDKYLLRNIINNLISNAIKFSEEDSDIIVDTDTTEDEIIIKISDSGIGIPESDQDKVFKRFYRGSNVLSYGEGTGLGLNIVLKYVSLLDGKITFESTENVGTSFIVRLPKK